MFNRISALFLVSFLTTFLTVQANGDFRVTVYRQRGRGASRRYNPNRPYPIVYLPPQQKCGPNEKFIQNKVSCPGDSCILNYVAIDCVANQPYSPGCVCIDGYRRDDSGRCIPSYQCPKPPSSPKCGPNEKFIQNKVSCPGDSCVLNYLAIDCVPNQPSSPGCVCIDGYRRDDSGRCIPSYQCPKPPSQPKCGTNEKFTQNKVSCPGDSCVLNYVAIDCVPDQPSSPGCVCNDGYLRDDSGQCIPSYQCPKPPPPKCGENEKFIQDKVSCPGDSCILNYVAVRCVANQTSTPGCVCNDGYLRNASGSCIPSDQCLKLECVNDPNAVSGCGNRCGKTCKTYKTKQPCPLFCEKNGCDCRENYVYDENKELCVKPEDCTTQCYGENEEYTSCLYADCTTPRTCDQVGNPSGILCPRYPRGGCPSGCKCKAGYVRDSSGNCIAITDCPSCGGDSNAVAGCGNPCGNSCTDYDKPDVVCPLYCEVNGCDCRDGFVYDATAQRCVQPNQCSNSCPGNSSYVSCNAKCPTDYCPQNDEPQPVCSPPNPCPGGCQCNLNYKLNKAGQCIVATECPPIFCTRPNEVYNSCPSACLAERCEDRFNQPSTCNTLVLNCQPACVCRKGTWRNKDGICVPAQNCGRCGK